MNINTFQTAVREAKAFIALHGNGGYHESIIVMMCHNETVIRETVYQQTKPQAGQDDGSSMFAPVDPYPNPYAKGDMTQTEYDAREYIDRIPGRRVTATTVAQAIGAPTDTGSLRAIGAILRSICGEPRRGGGKILYSIPGTNQNEVDAHLPAGTTLLCDGWWEGCVAFAAKAKNKPVEGVLTLREAMKRFGLSFNGLNQQEMMREAILIRNNIHLVDEAEEETYDFG